MAKELVIVSAFITNINKNRDISDYIYYGKRLLDNDISQIVFIEPVVFYQYVFELIPVSGSNSVWFEYEGKKYECILFGQKWFVLFEREDIYLYKSSINNFKVNTDNPNKDTLDYMFVQCHKTEWVKMATVLLSCFDVPAAAASAATEYMWIDFGIYHMFHENAQLFYEVMANLRIPGPNNKIRAASCWSPQMYELYSDSVYEKITWLFAGSVFGGSAENIVRFADLTKAKCLTVIQERNHLMWEVNIWALVYKDVPELFDLYTCGHDSTILDQYKK